MTSEILALAGNLWRGSDPRDVVPGRRRMVAMAWAESRRGAARRWRAWARRVDRWLEP